jgi:ATP-binding cassette, subfamily B, bacterial
MTSMPKQLPKTLLEFFIELIKPYRIIFAGQIIIQIFDSLSVSLNAYLTGKVIEQVSNFNPNIHESLWSTVIVTIAMIISLDQINQIALACYDYLKLKSTTNIRADIIKSMYAYTQQHSYHYFQNNYAGSLTNKISDMAKGVTTVLEQLICPLFSEITTNIIAIISMYLVHPFFGIILAIWSLMYLFSIALFTKKILKLSSVFSESHSLCIGKVADSITNIITVKLFSRLQHERSYLKQYITESTTKQKSLQWYMLKAKYLQGFLVTILFSSIFFTLIYAKSKYLITIGDFTIILTLSYTVAHSLWLVSTYSVIFFENLGVCKQALSIINTPHEIIDIPNASNLKVTKGEIVFEKVNFSYEQGSRIFTNKSIIIHGGQKVGLVGFSGSGKSTFVSLILRLYDPFSGKILIDNQDISKVSQSSLRAQIGMVPQDPSLMHRSFLENIQYGCLESSREQVIEASKRAHCHEFIQLMPLKYDTMVGERGIKLSGGQRQRIAIARAILKNAPILILDEATSSLDSITEQKIQESLKYLMQNKTTIIIAHRLSTLYSVDRILVFKDGIIVEDGTHENLLAINGHYAQLWNMQDGGLLPYKHSNSPEMVEQAPENDLEI